MYFLLRLLLYVLGMSMPGIAIAQTTSDSPNAQGKSYIRSIQIESHNFNLLIDTGATRSALPPVDVGRIKNKTLLWVADAYTATSERIEVEVYLVPQARFAGCRLRNVEIISLPGARYGVIGMQALAQMMPFTVTKKRISFTCPRQRRQHHNH